jgi:hypothetical protein
LRRRSGTIGWALRCLTTNNQQEETVKDKIHEHMEVLGSDGGFVGTVDYIQGTEIKLTKGSDKSGQHHLIPLDWVSNVDSKVHLSKAARDAKAQWRAAA